MTVTKEIRIQAPADKVWKVLITSSFIRQWDDLPEDFQKSVLEPGDEIVWKFDDGHQTQLTVTQFRPNEKLKTNLYVTRWEYPSSDYDIAYRYELKEQDNTTLLKISVGDFTPLGEKASNYYDASLEFAETAAGKIKELAEDL